MQDYSSILSNSAFIF